MGEKKAVSPQVPRVGGDSSKSSDIHIYVSMYFLGSVVMCPERPGLDRTRLALLTFQALQGLPVLRLGLLGRSRGRTGIFLGILPIIYYIYIYLVPSSFQSRDTGAGLPSSQETQVPGIHRGLPWHLIHILHPNTNNIKQPIHHIFLNQKTIICVHIYG